MLSEFQGRAHLIAALCLHLSLIHISLYGPLVQDYAGPGYADACRAWAAYAEKVCTGLSPERAARCRAIFHDCSVHELHFWEMSAKPRTDL